MRDVITREDLNKLATLYANKSRDELSQMTVSYEAVHALAQEYLRQRNHQCQVCHHRWEGPYIGTYCGDCHRAAREATLKSEQTQKSLDALQRLYDDLVSEEPVTAAPEERARGLSVCPVCKHELDEPSYFRMSANKHDL